LATVRDGISLAKTARLKWITVRQRRKFKHMASGIRIFDAPKTTEGISGFAADAFFQENGRLNWKIPVGGLPPTRCTSRWQEAVTTNRITARGRGGEQ